MNLLLLFALFLIGFVFTLTACYDDEMRAKGELRKACSRRGAAKQPKNRINTSDRLAELRKVMQSEVRLKDRAIDAYIVTSGDEHQTEYVAPYDRRIEYISGFSGSYGDAIITHKKAALWTDGRYHLQADEQMNCDWLLMREGQSKVPARAAWLKSELPPLSRIGTDPKLMSATAWHQLEYELQNSTLQLVPIHVNAVDLIWLNHTDTNKVKKDAFVWDMKYAGRNWSAKVAELRRELHISYGCDAMVVTALSEIAWLLNVRGRDIPYNPFLRSYILLSMDDLILYVDKAKLRRNNVAKHLNSEWGVSKNSITVRNYEDIWTDLPTMAQQWRFILVPALSVYSAGASHAIYNLVPESKLVFKASPIITLKARKSPIEVQGMEEAHIRDGAAMCEFLHYLESRLGEGDLWDELQVAKIVNDIRFEQPLSLGNSFETIVAFGGNGALPHYVPTAPTNAVIYDNSTLVIDSGGQYYDGTTDVTRTLHFGTPSMDQMEAYTRVLIGMIQLSSLIFPANLRMSMIDVMARQPLWEMGWDYMHGTGHGVGAFLDVHESPISVYYNSHMRQQVFKAGYFLSNEPGYYREGEFGVRLENVLEVITKPWLKHISGQAFLGFKDVTLVPFEPKLMNLSLLSNQHRRWLNAYNNRIRDLVGKRLKEANKMPAFYWMMEKTKNIPCKATHLGRNQFVALITLIIAFLCN